MAAAAAEPPEAEAAAPPDAGDDDDAKGDDDLESVKLISDPPVTTELEDPAILAVSKAEPQSRPRRTYSREVLMKLRFSPFSVQRPDYLDKAHEHCGIWDPERWHQERRTSESAAPSDGSANTTESENNRRRSGDPKDRLRREHDGIVLSPQRRSFNSGCFVPVRAEPARGAHDHRVGPHSPLGPPPPGPPGPGKPGDPALGHREIPPGPPARRIGSGRILPWEYQDKGDVDNDFGYRRGDDRFDRRPFDPAPRNHHPKTKDNNNSSSSSSAASSIFSRSNSNSNSNNNNNNSGYRRRTSEGARDEEPEWFSEGPTSQHDMIELRGFEDADRTTGSNWGCSGGAGGGGGRRKSAKGRARDKERAAARAAAKASDIVSLPEEKLNALEVKEEEDLAEIPMGFVTANDKKRTSSSDESKKVEVSSETSAEFNLDEFLRTDIPALMRNGGRPDGSSRFSQWFRRDSPQPAASPPGSAAIEDDHRVIEAILGDIYETTSGTGPGPGRQQQQQQQQPQQQPRQHVPGDASSYFAPISPAAAGNAAAPIPTQAFIDMIHRGKQQQQQQHQGVHVKNIGDLPGKILILEELEAKMRKSGAGGGDGDNAGDAARRHPAGAPAKPPPQQARAGAPPDPEESGVAAFNKLLAHMHAGNVVPAAAAAGAASNGPGPVKPPHAMSLMEMLSHSQKQDAAAAAAAEAARFAKIQQQQNQQRQQQMDLLAAFMNAQLRHQQQQAQARTTPPSQELLTLSRELLNRPEAQAIFQGLKRGDITPQNLYQQLANPAMQPRHRELLQAILRTTVVGGPGGAAGGGPSPQRVLSPMAAGQPTPSGQQQQQQQQQPQPQQQLRVSPLPPNAMQQRIPSPQELRLHTQHIMHNALIKKKLAEQSENFRKKQETTPPGAAATATATTTTAQPSPQPKAAAAVASPTQLAWGTPTSVLRKMTADKDDNAKEVSKIGMGMGVAVDQKPAGRALTAARQIPQPQQQQQQQSAVTIQQWAQVQQYQQQQQQQQVNKQGRAIVKNNSIFQQATAGAASSVLQQSLGSQQQHHEQFLLHQRIFNQQQQRRQQQQHQGVVAAQFGNAQPPPQQQQPQFNQHQLRAQHQARVQHQHQTQPQQQQQQAQPSQQQQQWLLQNQNQQSFDTRGGRPPATAAPGGAEGGGGDPAAVAAPSGNQLARWFSSELLDRARKGKLPTMPPASLAQHALSLEEVERQAAPAVHN